MIVDSALKAFIKEFAHHQSILQRWKILRDFYKQTSQIVSTKDRRYERVHYIRPDKDLVG